jgi:hypothetical protein
MSDTYTEFSPGRINQREVDTQGYGMVNYAAPDDRKIVLFYMKSVHQPMASQQEGRPVHKDVVFVKIGEPGEMKLSMIDRPATEADFRKWPMHYQQFRNNAKQVPDGTPIDLLFPEKPSIIATMKSYGIHTVEQLAHLSSEGISTVGMGAVDWVNKAKSYLERADKGVGFHKLQTELKDRDTKIAVLTDQVQSLITQIEHLKSRTNTLTNTFQPAPAPVVPTGDFDVQTAQINIAGQERDFTLPPTAFSNEIQQPKRRGRPPKVKETN